jgi:hypothetical protein
MAAAFLERVCYRAACGGTFHVSATNAGRVIFCSAACKTLHTARTCAREGCTERVLRGTKAKFCSDACQWSARSSREVVRRRADRAEARTRDRAGRVTVTQIGRRAFVKRPDRHGAALLRQPAITVRCQTCLSVYTAPWGAACPNGHAHETTIHARVA